MFLSLLDSNFQIISLVSEVLCTRGGKGISIYLAFQEKVVLCLSYLIPVRDLHLRRKNRG